MKTNIIIGMCIAIVLLTAGSASAWLSPYEYRQSINLTGGADGAQTDYQIKLAITYDADMQADFDDLRFTQADGETLVDAWLESKIDSTSAVVWVEFPTTPANGINQTYYMYYGNAGASSNWDIGETFLFGDDFPGSSLDTDIWDISSIGNVVATVAGGELHCQCASGDGRIFSKAKQYGSPVATHFKWKGEADNNGLTWIGLADSSLSTVAIWASRTDVGQWQTNARNGGATSSSTEGTTGSGTYQIWDILWKSSSEVEFFRGNVSQQITTTNVPSGSDLNFVIYQARQNPYTSDGYYDWITVHKYTVNPATPAFGSEEGAPATYAPCIIAYNNITGTRAHVPIDYGTTVLFNATVDGSVTWTWTLDGADQGVIVDTYTHTFSNGFGYYAVTVNATNSQGTDTYTWGVWENIETTAETIPTFTDTSYQMLLDSIDYPPDMEEFGKAMAHPFVQMVGVIFYLFIFGIPLLMMYIRQDNMTMPTTLLLLFGSIIIFMLPPQWQIIAGALMTLGFVGILFKLYKERER